MDDHRHLAGRRSKRASSSAEALEPLEHGLGGPASADSWRAENEGECVSVQAIGRNAHPASGARGAWISTTCWKVGRLIQWISGWVTAPSGRWTTASKHHWSPVSPARRTHVGRRRTALSASTWRAASRQRAAPAPPRQRVELAAAAVDARVACRVTRRPSTVRRSFVA